MTIVELSILVGLICCILLTIATAVLAREAYARKQYRSIHGDQDTDEIPVGKIRLGVSRLEDLGGLARPNLMPDDSRDDG